MVTGHEVEAITLAKGEVRLRNSRDESGLNKDNSRAAFFHDPVFDMV